MSNLIVFDTSILIDQLRANSWLGPLLSMHGTIRNSSVVLAELWRGAVNRMDREVLLKLEKNHTVLTPTAKNWLESGQICAKMRSDLGFNSAKLRDLHFDVLIALTVRSHGAKLITSNRKDFELIRSYRDFELEVW
jgi:predicted nucleic acid-binding protein